MDAPLSTPSHILDQTTELGGRTQGILFSAPDDRTGNRSRPPFFTVIPQDPHQLLPLCLLEQLGCGRTGRAHSHVERAVRSKAESAVRTVELERGASDVGEHGRGWAKPESPQNQRQPIEGLLDELHTIAEGPESLTSPGKGLGITIDADEPEPGLRPEQSLGMSSKTDRRVDQQTRPGRHKELHHPIGEHRQVFGGHSRPPSQLQLREFLEFLITQRRLLEE